MPDPKKKTLREIQRDFAADVEIAEDAALNMAVAYADAAEEEEASRALCQAVAEFRRACAEFVRVGGVLSSARLARVRGEG